MLLESLWRTLSQALSNESSTLCLPSVQSLLCAFCLRIAPQSAQLLLENQRNVFSWQPPCCSTCNRCSTALAFKQTSCQQCCTPPEHFCVSVNVLSQKCFLTLSGLYVLGLKPDHIDVWCNRCWTLSAGARRATMDALLDLSDIVVMTEVR